MFGRVAKTLLGVPTSIAEGLGSSPKSAVYSSLMLMWSGSQQVVVQILTSHTEDFLTPGFGLAKS